MRIQIERAQSKSTELIGSALSDMLPIEAIARQ